MRFRTVIMKQSYGSRMHKDSIYDIEFSCIDDDNMRTVKVNLGSDNTIKMKSIDFDYYFEIDTSRSAEKSRINAW